MPLWIPLLLSGGVALLPPSPGRAGTTNYLARGIVKAVRPEARQLVIAHEEIPNFMEPMTMPFGVKDVAVLTNASIGERIRFRLHVSETESWVDHIEAVSPSDSASSHLAVSPEPDPDPATRPTAPTPGHTNHPLRDSTFTNELGRPVRLADFRGQAVALTFFFTRCPIPEYCPRLSRNFAEVQRKLSAMANAPTNWHLLSVTFDPAHDTPEVLKAYATSYRYNPAHWSFLTGPQDKLAELARLCGVKFEADSGFLNHNFRTLIIDASNRLQMVFPTSGDLSDAIVQELLKGTTATNQSAQVAGKRTGAGSSP